MYITRAALLSDGICVWFGKEPRHYEENYHASGIVSLGQSDTHAHTTAWGWVDHLKEKNWWDAEIEKQFITECRSFIGFHGEIILK